MHSNTKVVPPPAPSSSHKYVLTIPVQQLPNVGFHLEYRSKMSNTGDEIGAKIKEIDVNVISNNSDSKYTYLKRMAVGDVLYRINGELVNDSPFQHIHNLIFASHYPNIHENERGATLRKMGSEYVMTLIMERQDRNNIEHVSSQNTVAATTSTTSRNNTRERGIMMNNMTNSLSVEASNKTESPIPKLHSKEDTSVGLPSPGDLSDEGNVLSSIFSPKFNLLARMNQSTSSNDTSDESEKNAVWPSDIPSIPETKVHSYTELGDERAPKPTLVPEGQSTDGEGSSFDDDDEKYFQSSSSALKYNGQASSGTSYPYENVTERERCTSTKNECKSECPSSPLREQGCPEENDAGVDSPTFSYSVTTVNTEQHLLLDVAGPGNFLSPIGVQISEQHSIDSETTSAASRRQYYDSRVNKLRQKYSFLSPDSVKDPTGMEIGSKSCGMSCSMSTVYMSPVLNISAGLDSRLPSVSEVQAYDQGVPKQIQVSFDNPFERYNPADESLTNQHINASEEMVEDMDAIVIAHAELKDQMDTIVRDRDQSEQFLVSQIESLETKVKDLKKAMKMQSLESSSRIESLEQSKAEAEKEMDDLRMALEHTTMDAEVLSQKLQEKELAIGELSGKLYKECAAAEACANALAKALTESESELLVMKEENKLSKQRISELEKELRSSRLLIDKLSGEIERYKLREKDFEQFKTKFKYATKLYKSRIQDLRSIVAQRNFESSDGDMEDGTHRVQENIPLSSTISMKLGEKENPPNIQSSFHIHTDDVEADSSPNKPVVSPSNGSNESNETFRQSKIRAAGGRAALRAKLKMRRQSKFERNATEKPSVLKPHNSNIRA